jgi:hypothetical protein
MPVMNEEEAMRAKLMTLRSEHRDLDEAIGAVNERLAADPLTLRRLKKRKLALKDEIARLEDRLTPDIIA